MSRYAILAAAAAASLSACAEPPPQPHANGDVIRAAVQLADARAEQAVHPTAAK